MSTHHITLRVRYSECDPMGVAHHAAYPVWFEQGRTEHVRARGMSYRDIEAAGVFLAVVELAIKYRAPARYDDELTLDTTLVEAAHVKILHTYRLHRQQTLIATASSTLACLDRNGRATAIPTLIRQLLTEPPPPQ